MTKTRKVYLSKWQRYFITPIMVGVWLLITYEEFFNSAANTGRRLGLFGYVVITGVLLVVLIMVWLMSSGKLPAYMIEEKDDGDSR